jgi:PAS domain S-box-containing protein
VTDHADPKSLSPWCIFIIDDSPEDRTELRRMLLTGSDRRIRFIETNTGMSAIEAILGTTPLPDCIVLDYNLPDMDAPDVLASLTGQDGITVCPVVVLTGGIRREDGKRVLRAGAQDYLGKGWTSPQALNRSVENACESWAMARELRQRGEALRLVADRQRFSGLFADRIRGIDDEQELLRVASELLGQHLGANRLHFAEVLDDGRVIVDPGYVSEVPQLHGVHRLDELCHAALLARLQAGEDIAVTDTREDAERSPADTLAWMNLGIVSYLAIPILKGGRLVAILVAHQNIPRIWTSAEVQIARDLAERTWAQMVQVRADATLLATRVQLTQIVAIMPSFSAVFRGSDHVIEQANQAFHDLVRRGPEIVGLPVIEACPEFVGETLPALLDAVYRTGECVEAKGTRVLLDRQGDTREMFIDIAYLPLSDADGRTSGIFLHGVDRTAEVRVNQALAQRERELHSVTDNIPDGLARFDRDFRFVFINPTIERILGRRAEDIIGRTCLQAGIGEPLCGQWEATIQEVFDTRVSRLLHFAMETGDEGIRHYATRAVPELDERGVVSFVLGVTHDITEEKRAHDRVRQSEARLELAIASSRIMVYTADRDLRYTWIRNPNPHFLTAQVLGHRDDELVLPEAAESLIRVKRAVFESGVTERRDFAVDIGGIRHHYDVTVAPLHGDDGVMEGVTVAAMNVTDRRLIEETLRQSDRRKDEFLATLAHELRNPLAPIRTGLELLKLTQHNDVTANVLPMMQRQLEHLVRLIDDLMDVSRISSGKFALRRERVTLQHVAAVAVEASRQLIDVAGQTLTTDWPDEPVWLDADPTRLAQIFCNLLNNSAKHTRTGGHIRLSAIRQHGDVLISVQDTGPGIPPEFIDSVFDMFTQLKRTGDHAQGGLGIGLALVRTLVTMHGGRVEVTSSGIDQGTTFTVTLPVADARGLEPVHDVSLPTGTADAGPVCQRILVVDDNVDAAETMVLLLSAAGHVACAAFAGRHAMELAPTFRPDVVFLDIGMPDLDGYDVARHLLADPVTASARLIALTGWGAPADLAKSRAAGFHAHLTKPVDMGEVTALLAAGRQSA